MRIKTHHMIRLEGSCELITTEKILKVLQSVKKGKAAGLTRVVSDMMMIDENLCMELLTDLCSVCDSA